MGKIKKTKQGFTLIEVLTVSGIMALFSITLIAVFLASFRGGNKSIIVQRVHQDGDYALKTIAREIRQADSVECLGSETGPAAMIKIYKKDGGEIIYFESEEKIASNSGAFLTSNEASLTSFEFECFESDLGNQVVSIKFNLEAGAAEGAQSQEKFSQNFATSVSTRQY